MMENSCLSRLAGKLGECFGVALSQLAEGRGIKVNFIPFMLKIFRSDKGAVGNVSHKVLMSPVHLDLLRRPRHVGKLSHLSRDEGDRGSTQVFA